MSTKEHPYLERSKGLIGVEGRPVTIHGEGQYPDGQPQHGVDLGKVRHGETAQYTHTHAHAYREDLRARPSAKPHRIFGKTAKGK